MGRSAEHPFYGFDIIRSDENDKITALLKKYKNHPVNDELRKKIWDDLQEAKHKGIIKIPFKVVMRRDARNRYPSRIEVILDSKV